MRGFATSYVYPCRHSAGMIPLKANMTVLHICESRFILALTGEDSIKLVRQAACEIHCKSQ
jgi:hypothetical protein